MCVILVICVTFSLSQFFQMSDIFCSWNDIFRSWSGMEHKPWWLQWELHWSTSPVSLYRAFNVVRQYFPVERAFCVQFEVNVHCESTTKNAATKQSTKNWTTQHCKSDCVCECERVCAAVIETAICVIICIKQKVYTSDCCYCTTRRTHTQTLRI